MLFDVLVSNVSSARHPIIDCMFSLLQSSTCTCDLCLLPAWPHSSWMPVNKHTWRCSEYNQHDPQHHIQRPMTGIYFYTPQLCFLNVKLLKIFSSHLVLWKNVFLTFLYVLSTAFFAKCKPHEFLKLTDLLVTKHFHNLCCQSVNWNW